MYYKIIKDNKVIDVLDHLVYLKWQDKHKIWILSDINEAQAILSSDQNTIYHERTLYNAPVEVETVDIVKIDEFEYKELKMLNGKTKQEIVDELILHLLETNII